MTILPKRFVGDEFQFFGFDLLESGKARNLAAQVILDEELVQRTDEHVLLFAVARLDGLEVRVPAERVPLPIALIARRVSGSPA